MVKGSRKKRKAKRVSSQTPDSSGDDGSYEEEDEDSVCRCICSNNDFTATRPWIQCTGCEIWQHNDCMDVSVFDYELDDHYWCEVCDPKSHTTLLAAVTHGERPWEIRCEQRLRAKAQFEDETKTILEQVEWLWELYEPQPSVVAGNDAVVPPKRAAPAHYVGAVQAAMEVLFDDLPMQSLRDLAQQLDASKGRHCVMRMLRKKAAAEYGEGDMRLLGVLSEIFEWVKKGELYSDEHASAAFAQMSS